MVVRVGKISISIKNGKYRGNIVSNEKASIAHPYCLYDPSQAGRDAYRDPARNTNSKECLYDPATYPA
jgi:hypothetical protein